jgi:arsenite-transporting ATPase
VLLVSTDPAPSVADALDQYVGEDVVAIDGAPGLFAQQLDASAAFERFRESYRERVDAVFDSMLVGSLDASHDRRIARDLLSLAPPGIDELYALASLGETLAEARYDTMIVDPAPTGHLLRLLEMPALALDWAHRLLRLMLKYKEVVRLGDTAQELLTFARRTRALDELLHDETRAGVLVVALDEPLVRAETARLVSRVRRMGVTVSGVLWNRSASPPSPLPTTLSVPHFEATVVAPPPRGVEVLRRWAASWEALQSTVHG